MENLNMTLTDYFNSNEYKDSVKLKTDKGTTHNYIEGYYNNEFTKHQYDSLNLMELGLAGGDSIKLWNGYFKNIKIVGIDRNDECVSIFANDKNIKIEVADGFIHSTLDKFQNNTFDYIIDDGPHTLESQIFSVSNWFNKLKIGGKLIIEDIQSIENLNQIISNVDQSISSYTIFDLRNDKRRYDDIIIEIIKLK